MTSWYRSWKKATFQTKMFVLTCIVYGGLILVSTAWCYARVGLVRSGEKTQVTVKPLFNNH